MSTIGPSSQAQLSALQATAAQQAASKSRDRDKARETDRRRLTHDEVELRVAGLETNTAVRQIPQNTSEQEREEHQAHSRNPGPPRQQGCTSKDRPPIDVQA